MKTAGRRPVLRDKDYVRTNKLPVGTTVPSPWTAGWNSDGVRDAVLPKGIQAACCRGTPVAHSTPAGQGVHRTLYRPQGKKSTCQQSPKAGPARDRPGPVRSTGRAFLKETHIPGVNRKCKCKNAGTVAPKLTVGITAAQQGFRALGNRRSRRQPVRSDVPTDFWEILLQG